MRTAIKKLIRFMVEEPAPPPAGTDLRSVEDVRRGDELAARARRLVHPKTGTARIGPSRRIKLPD